MNVRQINADQKRLRILGDDEIDAIYGRPRFTDEERQEHFSLSQPERELLQELRSIKSRAYFVLQLSYFKAKRLFFTFEFHEVAEDLQYVLERHFDGGTLVDTSSVDKFTRIKQQRLILKVFSYRSCDAEERLQLETRGRKAATVCGKPIYIFREMMHHLSEKRIMAPGYSFMQETVGKALTYEQNRLTSIMRDNLKQCDIDALKELLADSPGLYEITQLKHEPKDFSAGEIKREILRAERIHPLYQVAERLLPKMEISNESVKYYAHLVSYYSVHRLKRLHQWIVYVYLLCFVYHRYQRMNDNLIGSLIYNVRRYIDGAKGAAKERVYECQIESNQNLKKAGQVLKLFTDDGIAVDTPYQDVQATAFSILERPKLALVADHIATNAKFDETAFQWEHIDELAPQFKRHLRPILLMVDFAAPLPNDSLIEAIDFLKAAFRKGKPLGQYNSTALPSKFIPSGMKRYLYEHGANGPKNPVVDRYEFLVYRLLRNGLEAGDIYCRDSVRFRSFEDDLLDDQLWRQKEKLIADAGLTILNRPLREHLAELEQRLEERIAEVNRRIASGENKHFQIKKRGSSIRWTLQYPHGTEPVNHPFFDALKQIGIGSLLHFVNQDCRFLDAFEHVLGRYAKQSRDDRIIVACLIAWGTNMGLGRMGATSDIDYSLLAATSDNFIRLETLKEANDRVCNAIAKLPIFRHYDVGGAVHSSSDGQKFETRIDTINARHSPKYFGLKKGVVSYTLVANHIPVNAQIIGANEHESHYVFDILFNNTTDIQPDLHSTDTHGANQVNSLILYLFGYQFAPRYKDIFEKVSKSLYGFKHPTQYDEGWLIKPVRKINTDLILDEEENIKRIMLSLGLKTTTQSIIIGKLSAYARKNKTKRALWEYDNI
ncbi:MAG: Tn3 family transposase, partial [Syntrophobacteraceae bacterium]